MIFARVSVCVDSLALPAIWQTSFKTKDGVRSILLCKEIALGYLSVAHPLHRMNRLYTMFKDGSIGK